MEREVNRQGGQFEAILALGPALERRQGQEVEHLSDGQGDHGEVGSLALDRQQPDHGRHQGAAGHGRQ